MSFGRAGRYRGVPLVRSNLLASRASSLGHIRLPPHPPEAGGALAALLRRDDSRGGCVLRFGARYGSSDSLPMGTPRYRPY
jgi:hypothetical protein